MFIDFSTDVQIALLCIRTVLYGCLNSFIYDISYGYSLEAYSIYSTVQYTEYIRLIRACSKFWLSYLFNR